MVKANKKDKPVFTAYMVDETKAFSAQPKTVRAAFVFLMLSVFLLGLYFEWTAYLAGIVLVIINLYVIIKKRTIQLSKNPGAIAMALMGFCYFLTVFYGTDRGMALAGAVKMLVPLLFFVLILQLDYQEIKFLWHAVPDSAAIMLLISIVLWMIPQTSDFVSSSGRLGGLFQYSNTFALYLLLGIVVLMQQNKFDFSKGLIVFFLTGGILLTGSRFMFVLTIGWYCYAFVTVKAYRKGILISGGILVCAVIIYVLLSGNLKNVGRIFSILSPLGASTLTGRVLYWKDAFKIIASHPAGLGYLGYYYLQPSVQTGDYIVRFVHNDWIQFLLDGGIQTLGCLLVGLMFGLKKADKNQKILFVIIAAAGCFDFHLTYLSVFFLLLMTLNFDRRIIYGMETGMMKTVYGVSVLLLLLFSWLGLSFDFDYFGDYASACRVFPGNTESRIYLLQQTTDPAQGAKQADRIIGQNQYISSAYHCRAIYEKETGDYEGMMLDIERMLDNSRYRIEAYENALQLLSDSIQSANRQGDKALFITLIEQALRVPDRINSVLEGSDDLAWKITDVPKLTLKNNYLSYLKTLEETLEKVR